MHAMLVWSASVSTLLNGTVVPRKIQLGPRIDITVISLLKDRLRPPDQTLCTPKALSQCALSGTPLQLLAIRRERTGNEYLLSESMGTRLAH